MKAKITNVERIVVDIPLKERHARAMSRKDPADSEVDALSAADSAKETRGSRISAFTAGACIEDLALPWKKRGTTRKSAAATTTATMMSLFRFMLAHHSEPPAGGQSAPDPEELPVRRRVPPRDQAGDGKALCSTVEERRQS